MYLFSWWHIQTTFHIQEREMFHSIFPPLILDQLHLLLSVHFHNATSRVQYSPAQACGGGGVVRCPSCLLVISLQQLPLTVVLPTSGVLRSISLSQTGRPAARLGQADRPAVLIFGLLPLQCACTGWRDHPPLNIRRNP